MRKDFLLLSRYTIIVFLTLCISACAHDEADRAANDPASPINRSIFAGNLYVDRHVVRPVARAYAKDIPKTVRGGLHNFVSNLHEPIVLVNDLLQENFGRGLNTIERFTINTTVGGLGIFDVAQGWGMPHHNADFGQTFGVWGVGTGPDIQLPLLGFSNVRDVLGSVVGIAVNPASVVTNTYVSTVTGITGGLSALDARSKALTLTDAVERDSLDEYASLRSMRDQNRAAFILEGKTGRVRQDPLVGATPKGVTVRGSQGPKI